jgi:hypothetical protein
MISKLSTMNPLEKGHWADEEGAGGEGGAG